MADGPIKNTMDKPTTEEVVPEETQATPPTAEADAGTVPASEEGSEEPSSEEPSSTSTEEDLTPLIDAEKKRGPDPLKARERFLASQANKESDPSEEDEDLEQPLTRKEVEELLAKGQHDAILQANEDRIYAYSEEMAETPQMAELIRQIHKNRVFPASMSLREQIAEASAIANVKRVEAKNAELARAVQSQQNASKNTASTHRDPQTSSEPQLAADVKASMQRAGFIFNSQLKRYEKKLPNGKTLVKESNKAPYLAD